MHFYLSYFNIVVFQSLKNNIDKGPAISNEIQQKQQINNQLDTQKQI